MSDPTAGQLPANEPVPASPSVVAPSGGAGSGLEAEQQAGRAAAESNAKAQDEQRERRQRETINARQIASEREAAGNKDLADRAEAIRGMVKDRLPPPGPGLPEVDVVVIAATMDPNNPVLNPDMSEMGRTRNLPPGARVPAPVLPQDTIQTQFASKPPTEEHAKEGQESAKSLPEPIYPPAGSQPTVELTQEEQERADSQRGQRAIPQNRTQGPYPPGTQPSAQPYDPRYTGQR